MAMLTRTIMAMPTTLTAMSTSLATLFAWFSPAFPTGGFAYSHGLETAVAEGLIDSEAALTDWIEGILLHGAGWSDAVLLAAAHAAVRGGDSKGLAEVAGLAAAMAPCKERLAESLGQGEAFLRAVRAGGLAAAPMVADRTALPVAAGAATARVGADVETALIAYLNGFAANLIAAGVRLSVCGQTGAARTLAAVSPTVVALAARAARSSLDDLGGCAFGSEIAAMRHEALPTRLFIS
jgi:urease accessory protein